MIVLNIKPLGSGRFVGYVCGKPVVRSSRQPFLDAARAALARGTSADEKFVMVGMDGTERLKSTVGAAAALSVRDDDKMQPHFVKWRPRP